MIKNTSADWRQRYTLCFAATQPQRETVSRILDSLRSLGATISASLGGREGWGKRFLSLPTFLNTSNDSAD